MLYCEKCKTLVEGRCPKSGHALRAPEDNDPVLLMQLDSIQAGMAEAMLQENGIPVLKQGMLGAGLTTWTGGMLEEYSLYVPFAALEKAEEVLTPLLEPPADAEPAE